jgi:hypothetical protein
MTTDASRSWPHVRQAALDAFAFNYMQADYGRTANQELREVDCKDTRVPIRCQHKQRFTVMARTSTFLRIRLRDFTPLLADNISNF